ncbi:MAG TPA: ABC transporter permease [Thermoleophilia bacterium]|nr:ABC transporter permease [Thermoleophilia bacterium]
MLRFVVQRLISLVLTLFVASIVIYGALYLAPGDPATLLAGGHVTPSIIHQIHIQYHLNDPVYVRYWDWLTGILRGNLGQSFVYREPVTTLIAPRIGNTLFLVSYASILILVIGIALGITAGLTRRVSSAITVGTGIGLATPSFVAAILLITIFAVDLGWFPVFGAGSGFADRLYHLTLPAVALAISWVAYVSQLTRTSIKEELVREHVETARSRGIPENLVVRRHVLRNAWIPITTVAGLTVAGLIAGDVVVEQAFGIAGLGSFLVQATSQKDVAVVQTIALLLVVVFVVVNAIVDLVNGALDPRLTVTGRG